MYTIEQIYNETHQEVFNQIHRKVKNFHDCEEIRGGVYEKIIKLNGKDSTKFNPKKGASLNTWVHTITNSVMMDYFRSNYASRYIPTSRFTGTDGKEFFDFVAPENSRTDSRVLTAETQESIVKAFHGLKFKYRRVATLYFISGYEYSEIADMLNVPMGTVKGMINRSRAMLQEALKSVYTLRTVKQKVV